uniref:hypothetical protein n=1 Tax=Agathobacter sp. TaxID=2021311 RepID=UPI0040578C73
MNLRLFLKETDEIAAGLSPENLREFIHEIARTLSEDKREYFIKTLKGFRNSQNKTSLKRVVHDDGYSKLLKNIKEIKNRLMEINKGVRMLDSTYNEEWDDWYNSDADEVLFTDEEGIIRDIEAAMKLVHSCIDREAYKEGYELAEILSVLEISSKGDYNDFDGSPLYLHELSKYNLLSCDFDKFVKECLYLTYMGNVLDDRADELFCMMGNFECYHIKLEEILQLGNTELPDINEFLMQWISYLGTQKGVHADELLKEAQCMVGDDTIVLENARKYVKEHPSLYEQILCMGADSGNDERMFGIGMEALDKIPVSYVVRSNIALLSAECAGKQKDYGAAEKCWLEAFRSKTNTVNYLRLRCKAKDWASYEAEMKSIYEQAYRNTKRANQSYSYTEITHKENLLYKDGYCALLFFDEQFDRVVEVGMNVKDALGWSSTFMKEGLALFLLLLFEGTKLPIGLAAMLNRGISACGFEAAEYAKGTQEHYGKNNQEVFWKLFCQWKKTVQISEDKKSEWLNQIDKWIALRVKGIMENNRRNYYGECAEFIAAFGEVQESMGIMTAKSSIMERYRNTYSRRRAFHQELRNYGMKG